MRLLAFLRSIGRRQQAIRALDRTEVELGERVSPEQLRDYQEPEGWARLNPYQQDQLLKAKRAKN